MVKISIIIPCYNEAETIETVVRRVERVPLAAAREIIIVDDGSTDGSREIIESGFRGIHTLVLKPENGGKGSAVRAGLEAATGDIIIIQDADLELNPSDYLNLLPPLLDGTCDAVYGIRPVVGNGIRHMGHWGNRIAVFMASRVLSTLITCLYGHYIHDPLIGYKFFRKDALGNHCLLRSKRFEFEAEITAKLLKRKARIIQKKVFYHPRLLGKKIKWRDSAMIFWSLLKYRFID